MRRLIAAAVMFASCPATPVPAATPGDASEAGQTATSSACTNAVEATACVLPTVARNETAGLTWQDNVTKSGQACGVSMNTVTSLWLAHTQAESLEGFVPRPQK